jgi:DNA-3-methyladenine glycosylase II
VINKLTFESFQVEALAPFDFDLTALIFSSGNKQIRNYADGKFSQVLKINGKLVLIQLSSIGTIEQPKITVELKSTETITSKDKQTAGEVVKFIFNLDCDLCSFYVDIKKEPVMRQISKQLYGLKNPTTPTVFEALLDSIVEQQISLKVAQTIEVRLVKKFGDALTLDNETFYAYPTPQNIANVSISELQGCGLSERKAQYLQGAAQLVVEGKLDLENLKTKQNPDEIILELDAIRGIGIWTAELTMLRGMQKLDAFPADDLGLRRIISNYYCRGKSIKSEEAREIANAWGRWKGLAAFYLIMAEIKGITV